MKKGLLVALSIISNILFVSLNAQEDISVASQDTILTNTATLVYSDTLSAVEAEQLGKDLELNIVKDFKPNSTKAVLYSLIPGMGQIYNRKYWKLPIVYGGFMGVVYAVSWNGNMYSGYQGAYKDIALNPRVIGRWKDYVTDPNKVLNDPSLQQTTLERLKRRRDYFRRNRDLAIIIGVGLYTLTMIDAYVDAQLYDFNVTPDLSMTMMPVVWGPSQMSSSVAFGLQCNIVF